MTETLSKRSGQVYQYLLQQIESGEWPAESRIPTESDLCRRFDLSRNTVRKAVKTLIDEGQLESRQGSGTYVKPKPHNRALNNVVSLMYMGGDSLLLRIQKLAFEHHCILSVFSRADKDWAPEVERPFLQQVKNQRHRILLAVCTPDSSNGDLLRAIENNGTRVIHFDHLYRDKLPTNYLIPDYFHIGYSGAIRLIISGYRHFFFAGLSNDGPFAQLMKDGFFSALSEHGFSDGAVVSMDDDEQHGNCFNLWLGAYPTEPDVKQCVGRFLASTTGLTRVGVFCSSLGRTEYLLTELRECGVSVPDKYGIISAHIDELGMSSQSGDIDRIYIDRQVLYERGLREALKPDFQGLRELVKPAILKGKTLTAVQ